MAGPKTTTQKKPVKKAAAKTVKAKAAKKFVYMFTEGTNNKELFGGKGANLMGMMKIGLPVPPGFTISTEACTKYYTDGQKISAGITAEILENVKKLEKTSGKKFGDVKNPLLVSVRSGSRASMPGMMDTVLNLGINDQVVEGLAHLTGNVRFAYDCYRRFIQMFSDVVMGLEKSRFEKIIDAMKAERNIELDTAFSGEDLKEMVVRFKAFVQKELGRDFPQDPIEQLIEAIQAVFRSWMNHRAIVYRRMHDIPESWGTAVNVQSMVFGNMGETSGTGVAFSRNPSTGENKLYGEYLMNAQGEDVVAGIRTPNPIAALQKQNKALYEEFVNVVATLEANYHDMQDMEFTIENGKLFMLQTRNGKRTAQAALKIAVDMVEEGKITKEEALMKIDPKTLDTLLHPTFDPAAVKKADAVASGLPASPGAASGGIVFDAETAKQWKAAKKKCILVRLETSPEDIEGMEAAEGILTARGGMTSHAAVVARGMGTACVAGCGELKIDEHKKTVTVNGVTYNEGQDISIDGSTGKVYMEILATVPASLSGNFGTIMSWTDEFRALGIRANADSPKDAATAYKFGARGIGLCRTEHMFFAEDRIPAVREMIVAQTKENREKALAKLLPMQRKDFIGIFTEMKGCPCTIRFLDPPLHEFLPHDDEGIQKLAEELGLSFKDMKNVVSGLVEQNPMMGHRGLRLAITYPEIAVMQTKAVIEAALKVQEKGMEVHPEIMIPLTCEAKELKFVTDIVRATANEIIAKSGQTLDYKVGTMIEIPRACLLANEIAKEAEFFSFGTNDLTQMTYGFSRDDAGKFLPSYYETKIFENDPFARLDQSGVGKLVETACKLGKSVRKDIKLGICGEHGGEPSSIEFCHKVGLTYVSCSPFRVPIARLAAAQANITFPRK